MRKKKHKAERRSRKSQEEEGETQGGRERVEGYFLKK